MSGHEAATIFDDDFSDLFNNPMAMDIQENADAITKITKALENDVANDEKLREVQKIVIEMLPNLLLSEMEETILIHVLPFMKTLLVNLFKEVEETLTVATPKEKTNQTVGILKEFLQVSINVHETLNCILKILLNNERINLGYVNCLPLNVVDILLVTFQHCKESNNLYGSYFGDLKEILTLFKETQNVHMNFLKLFEGHIKIDELSENQVTLLRKVLQGLEEIGIVLNNMNQKALTDNWKCYMLLVQKHSDLLKTGTFDTSTSIHFLFSESANNLNTLRELDQKGAASALKLSSFYIKIAQRLCDIFSTSLTLQVFKSLADIYRFSPPILKMKDYSDDLIDQSRNLIFTNCTSILDTLVVDEKLFQVLCGVNVKEVNCLGFLFLLIEVFKNLPGLLKKEETVFQFPEVHLLLELLFDVVGECYSELFWNINVPIFNQTQSLYDEIYLRCACTILCSNQKQYNLIELVLFKNCLRNNLRISLLATDIWCLVLRKKSPQLVYETIGHVISKTDAFLLNSSNDRPEIVYLEVLLQRLFRLLPENHKSNLIKSYPPLQNVHIWKVFGLNSVPPNEILFVSIVEKIIGLNLGSITAPDWDLLCNLFDLVSCFPKNAITNSKISVSYKTRFWNFDVRNVSKNSLTEMFLKKVCAATINFILDFNSAEWLLILTKLKELLSAGIDLKLLSLEMLGSFSDVSFASSQEKSEILATISQIFRLLLCDKNVIIHQQALNVFMDFLKVTPHREVLQLTTERNTALQTTLSNFSRKVVAQGTIKSEEYFNMQKSYTFQHQCSNLLGVESREDADVVIKRIKTDIELLHRLRGEENVSERNLGKIFSLLGQQLNCRF